MSRSRTAIFYFKIFFQGRPFRKNSSWQLENNENENELDLFGFFRPIMIPTQETNVESFQNKGHLKV